MKKNKEAISKRDSNLVDGSKPSVNKPTKTKANKPIVVKKQIVKKVETASTDNVENKVETDTQNLSKIELLRKECDELGIAYAPSHTEQNLQDVIDAVKKHNSGEQPIPINPMPEGFELNSSNIDEQIQNAPNVNSVQPLQQNNIVQHEGNPNIDLTSLNTHRETYLGAIKNHFRLLTVEEIKEMINRSSNPFSYEIRHNPIQQNQIEIFFKNETEEVRLPSENTNEWLSING